MKIILKQSFPLGRYHANPWRAFAFDDPHGEWPPSPWRLLRAILARSFQLDRELGTDHINLREQLAAVFCRSQIAFQLPAHSWRGPGLQQYQPSEFKASNPKPRDFIMWKIDEKFGKAVSSFLSLPEIASFFAYYEVDKVGKLELFDSKTKSIAVEETTQELKKAIADFLKEKLGKVKPKDFWLTRDQKKQQQVKDKDLAKLGGTRFKHYFPDAKTYNTTKNKDNFWLVSSENDALYWVFNGGGWQEPDLLAHLDACLARMTYFGRAESTTVIVRVKDASACFTPNCTLQDKRTASSVPVLCPCADATLKQLCATTADNANFTTPPGAVWKYAERPAATRLARRSPVLTKRCEVSIAQFAVGGHVFPSPKYWLRITERFRGIVLRILKERNGDSYHGLSLFTGKNPDGTVLAGYRHAAFFLIPDSLGKPSRLICWRKEPFTDEEQTALLAAAEVPLAWDFGNGDWKLRLVPLPTETPLPSAQDIFASAMVWESLTPFVPPLHHLDRKGKPKAGFEIETQIKNTLTERGLPVPTDIAVSSDGVTWVKVHRPYRTRDNQTNDDKRAYRIRLTFVEPVTGPLALGHSSHFGLGLFAPEDIPGCLPPENPPANRLS